MADVFSRKDVLRLTKGLGRFPDVASDNIFAAQTKNADEARRYMQLLVPVDEAVTKSESVATSYRNTASGSIGFAMRTERKNKPGRRADKHERIKAILFANETDFFYGVWNLNKKRWKGRLRRAMRKSAKEIVGAIR